MSLSLIGHLLWFRRPNVQSRRDASKALFHSNATTLKREGIPDERRSFRCSVFAGLPDTQAFIGVSLAWSGERFVVSPIWEPVVLALFPSWLKYRLRTGFGKQLGSVRAAPRADAAHRNGRRKWPRRATGKAMDGASVAAERCDHVLQRAIGAKYDRG